MSGDNPVGQQNKTLASRRNDNVYPYIRVYCRRMRLPETGSRPTRSRIIKNGLAFTLIIKEIYRRRSSLARGLYRRPGEFAEPSLHRDSPVRDAVVQRTRLEGETGSFRPSRSSNRRKKYRARRASFSC